MFNTTAVQQTNKSGGGNKQNFGPTPAGMQEGRIVRVVGYGQQLHKGGKNLDNPYNKYVDKEGNPQPTAAMRIAIEFPDLLLDIEDKDGNKKQRPRWEFSSDIPIKFFTDYDTKVTKLHEKSKLNEIMSAAFPEHTNNWTMDKVAEYIPKLIGAPIQVFIAHKPNKQDPSIVYANIKSYSALSKRAAEGLPELDNEPLFYDPYNHDEAAFNKLAPHEQERIKNRVDAPQNQGQPVQSNTSQTNHTQETETQAAPSVEDEPW